MIKAENISKTYKETQALENINFEISEGEIFGLIGPDGAGKTTLFRILTTLILPNEGKASMNGLDVVKDFKEIRKITGYMPGRFSLYQDLTVEENLNFYATVFGTTLEENYELIKDIYVQIEPFKKRRAGKLSGGMKQKLALSCALIHKPKILILDEPTTGVDAVSRAEFWQMLQKLKKLGITIMVSTPYMDEAMLCDRVALIQKGKIFSVDKPQNIVDSFDKKLLAVKGKNKHQLIKSLRSFPEVDTAFAFGESAHVTLNDETIAYKTLIDKLEELNNTDVSIEETDASIEDYFLQFTNTQKTV